MQRLRAATTDLRNRQTLLRSRPSGSQLSLRKVAWTVTAPPERLILRRIRSSVDSRLPPAQDKKKGADTGIDGVIRFFDDDSGKAKTIVVQVKSGNVEVRDIRELKGVLEREEAVIGAFITLRDPTGPMKTEAASAGFYEPEYFPKVLEDAEREALISQFNIRYRSSLRNLCMIRIMLEAGLRAGEVVALRPDHLNMLSLRLIVREGKGAKDRTLWINENLRDLIGEWRKRRPESEWLFPTRNGTKLDTRYLRDMVKRYAKKAGVQEVAKVSPHTLRHTFATDLLRETKNIRLVQKALGHANLSTTQVYTHIVDEELESALKSFRKGKDRVGAG